MKTIQAETATQVKAPKGTAKKTKPTVRKAPKPPTNAEKPAKAKLPDARTKEGKAARAANHEKWLKTLPHVPIHTRTNDALSVFMSAHPDYTQLCLTSGLIDHGLERLDTGELTFGPVGRDGGEPDTTPKEKTAAGLVPIMVDALAVAQLTEMLRILKTEETPSDLINEWATSIAGCHGCGGVEYIAEGIFGINGWKDHPENRRLTAKMERISRWRKIPQRVADSNVGGAA